jgi:hypothetical protein
MLGDEATPDPEAMDEIARALTAHAGEAIAKAIAMTTSAEHIQAFGDACAREARAAAIEEAAAIARKYADNPTSGDHNNTQAAFDLGMDHRAGCQDSASAIEQAIRALAAVPPHPGRPTDYPQVDVEKLVADLPQSEGGEG